MEAAEYAGQAGEASSEVAARVQGARTAQVDRGQVNRQLAPSALYESSAAQELVSAAVGSALLTARGADRVRRVARTIADLAGVDRVDEEHMAEAVGLRGDWRDD
ncbi:MAG: hypothetical protein M3P87_08880 [Actinomycetota bacterium]|nr:hypothetical protein [Actinomycetota bacterium]